MCGIAGFTHFDRNEPVAPLLRALDAISHRGPDQNGIFESPDVALGAVRLKILDLSAGDQPIYSRDGDLIAVFNGEIYNHIELRRLLEAKGYQFRTNCDTEVVLCAFQEWDVQCFEHFRGMFAVAFWQVSKRRLVLARDRLGIKPLYYAVRHGNVYFGSELKAILEHPSIPRQLSELALGYFLSMNYVPGPITMVAGIAKLLPGSWLECCKGSLRIAAYWRNTFEPDYTIGAVEAREELDSLLSDAVREHLASDVPAGIWLSGGLDSSTILHYAARHASQAVQTFSISFSGHSFDESRYFRRLAQCYGTKHYEFDVNSDLDLESTLQDMSYYSDEPGADAGALPVWFLSKATRKHAVVALSGEGADEVFGGYQTYVADDFAQRARRLPRVLLRFALRCCEQLPVSDQKIGVEYKLKRFLSGCLLSADEAHFFWNGAFSNEQKLNWGLSGEQSSVHNLCRSLPGIPGGGSANRYLFADQHFYLPDNILYKCDRMSMAHAVEVRPPFLDHRIVEFASRLPVRYKVHGRRTKLILRSLMRDKLPEAVLRRPKEGFDIPAHAWLRGPLRPLLLEVLSPHSVRTTGIFEPHVITRLVEDHLARKANLGYHLWGLTTLHLWARRWSIEPLQSSGEGRCTGLLSAAG